MSNLPPASPEFLTHCRELTEIISKKIRENGPLSFEDYMHMCLYHGRYGYYRSRPLPMGAEGDFITAPEISPYFSYCLAKQCHQVLAQLPEGSILELGAGSGRMASDLLQYCLQHGQLPKQYLILEPCAQLRTHQQKHLKNTHPQLFTDESPIEINWIETIPEQFSGIIVANEVLDAMPVQMVRYQKGWQQMMVGWRDEQLIWSTQSCDQDILEQISALNIPETEGYTTEINRQGPAWLQSLAEHLSQGLILLIDYGMPKSSYYHPQRNAGTLRCHWQHHAHDNPLLHPGGQDITAHVDFTTLAEAGMACGLDLLGYCHQAGFLLSLGLHEMPEATDGIDNQLKQSQQIKQLTLPSGMGELFKAIAFGKNIDSALQGFQLLDQRDQLFTESASH